MFSRSRLARPVGSARLQVPLVIDVAGAAGEAAADLSRAGARAGEHPGGAAGDDSPGASDALRIAVGVEVAGRLVRAAGGANGVVFDFLELAVLGIVELDHVGAVDQCAAVGVAAIDASEAEGFGGGPVALEPADPARATGEH